MKYDESDNVVVRASRAITDRVSQLLGESNLSPFKIGRIGVCGRTVCALFAQIPTSPENLVQTRTKYFNKNNKNGRKKKSYPNVSQNSTRILPEFIDTLASVSYAYNWVYIWGPFYQNL